MRVWRDKNPAKSRQANQKSYERHREERIYAAAQYREENYKIVRAREREHYTENAEEICRRARERGKSKSDRRAYYRKHREHIRAQGRDWYARRRTAVVVTRQGAWTPAEEAVVMRNDISTLEMALMLGRSYFATQHKRSRLTKA